MSRLAQAGLALGGAAAAGFGYALVEAHWFVLRAATVPVLPDGAKPLSILHLSDLHLLPRQRRKVAWVRALARLEPDLVVTTGDNLASPAALDTVLEALEPFLNGPGAFVFGGHDYFAPGLPRPTRYLHGTTGNGHQDRTPDLPGDELAAAQRAAGWHDLNNARAAIELAGLRVGLAGVADPHESWDEFPAPSDDDPDLRLGVVHAPYRAVLQQFADDGAALVLAGHTHGGQLCLPGIGTLVTNCDLDRRQGKGLSRWPAVPGEVNPDTDERMWLHVSAGLGTAPQTPVRFACRPEATLLTLVARYP